MYKVIDLFAGAGGLSLGFVKTNKFEIMAAVEKNYFAKETYTHYFPGVDVYDDINDVDFSKFNKIYGKIDVVIGGPPCQGFSNANRQHNQAINQNNKLVKQYIRAILQIQPKAFVMENVSMLKSDVHRFYIEKSDERVVEEHGIPTKDDVIFLLDEKWTFKGIIGLLEHEETVESNLWSDDLFKSMNIIYKNRNNQKKFEKALEKYAESISKLISKQPRLANKHVREVSETLFKMFSQRHRDYSMTQLTNLMEEPLAIQKMLFHTKEIYSNEIECAFDVSKGVIAKVRSCAVYDYLTCILGSNENGYAINNGILAAVDFGIPQKRRRFVILGVKRKLSKTVEMPVPSPNTRMTSVYDAIADLQDVPVFYSVEEDIRKDGAYIPEESLEKIKRLRNLRARNRKVYNHVVPNTKEVAMRRFKAIKPGENFHALSKELKENTYTDVDRTQNTVYLRLVYSEPSGTVINVRKSMWIHPALDRAVSIREAARLQTFPDSFRFYGPKDAEYQQVGNAVPPMLAQIIAKHLLSYIEGNS